MTDQPPPPPLGGEYPPPPPPAGGYVPPPPGPAIRGLPNQAYTPWLTRVGAYLVDILPFAVILGAGWLILCSDGLWNYANSADDLGKLFDTIPKAANAHEISEFLTDWANKQGGKDNVTAVTVAI